MNANKQDVGGLPELPPLPASTLADHWHTKKVMHTYSAAQMREYAIAYAELCRAAPAGGECQHEWQPDADVMNARYCPKCDVTQTIPRKPKDSAPAGSGEFDAWFATAYPEVNARANEGDLASVGNRFSAREGWNAALLRKLQQGAE